MKISNCKSCDDRPLFLNASMVSQVLGVLSSSGYELMHEPGFPVLRVGSHMVEPKKRFIQWVERNTFGVEQMRDGVQRPSAGPGVIRGTIDSLCPMRYGSTSASQSSL